jgi:hypothetical protein
MMLDYLWRENTFLRAQAADAAMYEAKRNNSFPGRS